MPGMIVSRDDGPAKSVFTSRIYPWNCERKIRARKAPLYFPSKVPLGIFQQTNLNAVKFIGRLMLLSFLQAVKKTKAFIERLNINSK